ncbi:acyl-CoA dehydrogenase [Halieaceae bacterium IMCC8485]|jgi:acyl-CoA dehydrogenase|uniref:Acyl-CoA dehydrogenase n=1 Tax=Candidatus Seongchinamella marina TaxID=2518990 RepID=A0ABT3SSH5_9GAMM|nr:acyl-CoA dehydrogenase family protein [Candidatus Seongchinamella marina]MCX2972272.1 acyl-CoA dehydrogenase [Candidatus Seongchinamella marina]
MNAPVRRESLQDLEQFRSEARQWLEENCPQSQRQPMTPEEQYYGGRNAEFPSEDAKLWFERMRDQGWIGPEWPTQYGGGDLTAQHSKIIKEEMRAIRARTPLYGLGIWMLGPALLEFGNEAQKQQHIRAIIDGKARWAQGYSEPGSGSDLASLQCRAEDKGDHFLVNGSKIWTTAADKCDWIFCLVRTDPDAKKQEGISFLLIDMDDPGISTTPIGLISGESEFCQTFFDNVKVPKENLVGELNKGWSVAKELLVHERKLMSEIGSDSPREVIVPNAAAREYLDFEHGKIADSQLRSDLVDYDMNMHAIGLTHFRTFEEKIAGVRSAAPMVMKYVGTEAEVTKSELLLAIMGSQGLGWEGDGFSKSEIDTLRLWAMSKIMTIAGGTSEIQLNVIAKNVLQLPQS